MLIPLQHAKQLLLVLLAPQLLPSHAPRKDAAIKKANLLQIREHAQLLHKLMETVELPKKEVVMTHVHQQLMLHALLLDAAKNLMVPSHQVPPKHKNLTSVIAQPSYNLKETVEKVLTLVPQQQQLHALLLDAAKQLMVPTHQVPLTHKNLTSVIAPEQFS
jgi:hypothetical protein